MDLYHNMAHLVALIILTFSILYALLYLPWEANPLSSLEQAKLYLAYILAAFLLLVTLLYPNKPRLTRAISAGLLSLLGLTLVLQPGTALGNWVWGRDTELIVFPLITPTLLLATIYAISKLNSTRIVTGFALAAIFLYPLGALAALGVLNDLGYAPFLHRTPDFFPRAFTWPSQGYAAGVFAPFAAFFLIRSITPDGNRLHTVAASVLLALMLAGGNRTGPAAYVLAAAITVLLARVPLQYWLRAFMAFTLLSGVFYTLYPRPAKAPTTFERGLHAVSTLNSRTYLWQGALLVLRNHPFGVGPDNFYSVLALEHPKAAETIAKKLGAIPREATEVAFLTETPLVRMRLPGIDKPVFARPGKALAHNGFLDLALAYGIPVATFVYLGWLFWMVKLLRTKQVALFAANVALFSYSALWTPIFSVLFPFAVLNAWAYRPLLESRLVTQTKHKRTSHRRSDTQGPLHP